MTDSDAPNPDQPAPDQPAPDQPAPDQPAPDQPAPDQPAPDQPAFGPSSAAPVGRGAMKPTEPGRSVAAVRASDGGPRQPSAQIDRAPLAYPGPTGSAEVTAHSAAESGAEEPPIVLSEPYVAPISMTSPTAEAVTWPVRVASEWAARLLIVAVAGYILLLAIGRISLVAFSVVLGIFFTSVLHPIEARLRAKIGHKSLSTAVVLLGGIVVFGLVGWFVYDQISAHSVQLGDQVNNVGTKIRNWLQDGPLHVRDTDLDKWTANLTSVLKSHQTQVVSSAFSTAKTVFELLGGLFLSLISTYFLMRDGDQVWQWVLGLAPRAARPRINAAGKRGWSTLGGYVRGQVTIAFIHAVTIFFVLLILRVPLAAALAVLIFLGSFIPILGLTISGALCVAITLLEHGATAAIVVAIAIIALVQIEGNLLQPLIMSRAVHIHPLAVALAVAAGTTLDGIVGALIAVPLAAFTNSFVRALRAEPVDPVTEDA